MPCRQNPDCGQFLRDPLDYKAVLKRRILKRQGFSQNPPGFEKSLRKNGLKPVFFIQGCFPGT
jgi:hypothetical protein